MVFLFEIASAVLGLVLAVVGFIALVRSKISVNELMLHGGPAVGFGISLIGCGCILMLVCPATIKPQLFFTPFLRPGIAIFLFVAAVSLSWEAHRSKRWSLIGWAIFILIVATGVMIPPESLAAIVYRSTGDKRFKAPFYGN